MIQIWPRISLHQSEDFLNQYSKYSRTKREPISLTIATILGVGGIAAGIGTGASALVQVNQYQLLYNAMNEDLQDLERSIRALKDSLTSLSEVVLENRRGLDLLFLKEGGLCAALKEECCFYADQTGVVTETLDKLKERLDKRQKELTARQGCFERLFNNLPG